MYFSGGELRLRIETASDVEAYLMDLSFNIEGADELILQIRVSDLVVIIDVRRSTAQFHWAADGEMRP